MRQSRSVWVCKCGFRGGSWLGAVFVALAVLASPAQAKPKPKAPAKTEAAAPAAATPPLNACGCYPNDQGGCVCTKKNSKCECPGECEPVGCDKKRNQELEREMAAEVKRAQEDEKKRKAAQKAEDEAPAKRQKDDNAKDDK
jgi:hypothetical protein